MAFINIVTHLFRFFPFIDFFPFIVIFMLHLIICIYLFNWFIRLEMAAFDDLLYTYYIMCFIWCTSFIHSFRWCLNDITILRLHNHSLCLKAYFLTVSIYLYIPALFTSFICQLNRYLHWMNDLSGIIILYIMRVFLHKLVKILKRLSRNELKMWRNVLLDRYWLAYVVNYIACHLYVSTGVCGWWNTFVVVWSI